jgi:hypothetical protein
VLGLAALVACASQGEPPGGPPDVVPPIVLAVRPDSGVIVPDFSGDAVIQFDDVIDEMPTATGTGLAKLVLLSPVAGPVDVSWHRRAIYVHPKEGWKPGRVYHLELLPGVADLRRNITKQGRTVIFSTGPALPHASLSGLAVMWVEQRPLVHGVIRAVLKPDTIGYLAVTDSSGAYHLNDIPVGRYVVYAIDDQNKNHAQDRREAYDSTAVTLDSSATAILWAFTHDTAGPRSKGSEPIDSLSVRVEFTQALDVTDRIDTSRVRLFRMPDSIPVPISAVLTPAANDSLVAKLRAAEDSARKAADTTHQAGDTTQRGAPKDTSARPALPPRPAGARGAAAKGDTTGRAVRDTAKARNATATRVDTSAAKRLLLTRPVPLDRFIVRVNTPLVPKTKYVMRIRGVRNLNGATDDVLAIFETKEPPKPKPAADSSRARPDTAKHP